nr:PREDICTED: uncharacterized protein LOC105680119 [Linepithema humile]
MGRSHKSRKRRRSPSPDRFAALERKMSRIMDMLSRSEVRAPSCPSPSTFRPLAASQEDFGFRTDSVSGTPMSPHLSADSNHTLAPLVRQEEPSNPELSGENPETKNNVSVEQPERFSIEEDVLQTPPAPVEDNADPLTRQLFGSELGGNETLFWNELPLVFLKAPTLNQECKVALKNSSVVKRDDYAKRLQDQAGLALCALDPCRSFLSHFLEQKGFNYTIPQSKRQAYCRYHSSGRSFVWSFLWGRNEKGSVHGKVLERHHQTDASYFQESSATHQTTDATRSVYFGKLPRPCTLSEIGNEEDRGTEQQSPIVSPLPISDEEEVVNEGLSSSLEQNFPGGREVIRQAFLLKGIPPSALAATLASLSKATIAQYSKPIKLWWLFCKEKDANCFAPSVSLFLEFLSSLLERVGSYATLNTYRSAISLLSQDEIGAHPLVKRFCKGVAALKPQRPRYDYMWDPAPVISHLASLYPHEDLSLEAISLKLVTLLALTTAQRLQTLAAIQLPNVSFSDSLIIRIPARLKTSGIGRSQPLLFFKPFVDKPELCIFSLIRFYLTITGNLRQSGCDSLFISFRAPYNAVSAQTLGRWVKAELHAAGVDITLFSAHSTRHASTSLAANRGISIEEIRRTAGWSKTSQISSRLRLEFVQKNYLESSEDL